MEKGEGGGAALRMHYAVIIQQGAPCSINSLRER